jgi:hypothetical protein
MNLERLNQIEEVYHAARETPAGGREVNIIGAEVGVPNEG